MGRVIEPQNTDADVLSLFKICEFFTIRNIQKPFIMEPKIPMLMEKSISLSKKGNKIKPIDKDQKAVKTLDELGFKLLAAGFKTKGLAANREIIKKLKNISI